MYPLIFDTKMSFDSSEPSRCVQMVDKVFLNLSSFYLGIKMYDIQNGKKKHSEQFLEDFPSKINHYYWTSYSKSHDRLYILAFLSNGHYVYMKIRGICGTYGNQKKMRIYFCKNYEELVRTAFTPSEYDRYMRFVSHV